MRICTLMMPIVGFQIVSASYFQAVGKPKEAMLLMLSRQLLILVPAVLILPHFFGLDGVWAAMPTADLGFLAVDGLLPALGTAALARPARDGESRRSWVLGLGS